MPSRVPRRTTRSAKKARSKGTKAYKAAHTRKKVSKEEKEASAKREEVKKLIEN